MNDPLIDLLRSEVDRRVAAGPPAPTPERVLLAVRRQRRLTVTMAAIAVLLFGGGVTAFVQHSGPSTAPPIIAPTPTPNVTEEPANTSPDQAHARNQKILNAVLLPDGATRVDTPPVAVLKQPVHEASIDHLVDDGRIWTVPGTLDEVKQFFETHTENNGMATAAGSLSGRDGIEEYTFDYGSLLIGIAPINANSVGIRADAQQVWNEPKPAVDNVPEGVTSVDIDAHNGETVLASRTVTGQQAEMLQKLVNQSALALGRGSGCVADFGVRHRLVFHLPAQTYEFTGFFCGGMTLTIDGGPPTQLGSADTTVLDRLLGPYPSGPSNG